MSVQTMCADYVCSRLGELRLAPHAPSPGWQELEVL